MSSTEAQINEIFSSIQGEGLYVGERQIFVRFSGCNLTCQYCDTVEAQTVSPTFKVELNPGHHKIELHKNPANLAELLKIIDLLNKPAEVTHSICLSGGEPLLQVDFLKVFIPELKRLTSLPIYLETNGTLPDHLAEIIDLVDIIAMDIKLPGATGQTPFWKEHQRFLETAYLKKVFVKIVFTKETSIKELDEALILITKVDENIPLVLQPATSTGQLVHKAGLEQIFAFQNLAKRKLKIVKVIPQVHKYLGLK